MCVKCAHQLCIKWVTGVSVWTFSSYIYWKNDVLFWLVGVEFYVPKIRLKHSYSGENFYVCISSGE